MHKRGNNFQREAEECYSTVVSLRRPLSGGRLAQESGSSQGWASKSLRYNPCVGCVATGWPPYVPTISRPNRTTISPTTFVSQAPHWSQASFFFQLLPWAPGLGVAELCLSERGNMKIKVFYPGCGSPRSVFPVQVLIRSVASTLVSQPCHSSRPLMLGRSRLTCTMGSVALKLHGSSKCGGPQPVHSRRGAAI